MLLPTTDGPRCSPEVYLLLYLGSGPLQPSMQGHSGYVSLCEEHEVMHKALLLEGRKMVGFGTETDGETGREERMSE